MNTIAVFSYSKTSKSTFPVTSKFCDVFVINQDEKNMYLSNMSSFNKGSKWENILWFLEEMNLWDDYTYMWFPDETITMDEKSIETYLDIVTNKNLLISQPSVDTSCRKMTHSVLLTDKKQVFRKSTFVGIDSPCFHVDFVKTHLIPVLQENRDKLKTGWGLDMWWSQMNSKDLYIVDAVSMKLNPSTSSNIAQIEMAQIGMEEKDHFARKYDLKNKI